MTGLLEIQTVRVSQALANEANDHLRRMGKQGFEGFALWAGSRDGNGFHVRHTLIPAQTGERSPSGVLVRVDAVELHRINLWLYKHQMTVIAQLHSHPGEAYHSATDDTFPIATTLGALSIVVPHFARQPFSLTNCAIYRLLTESGWTRLSAEAVSGLIRIDG